MILIADSGSTKTDWKCSDGTGMVIEANTGGINPYYLDSEAIEKEILIGKNQLKNISIDRVYFYGAGCSTPEKKQLIYDALITFYKGADIFVNNDLLGAARALCQYDKGIACILGTGSGSCVYDGMNIMHSIPSLGFILGDEGSGAYLGKQLIKDFLREEMPSSLIQKIREELLLTKEIVLENVNRKPMPSKYLAQFSKFISQHREEPYIEKLLKSSFNEFIDKYIVRYKESNQFLIHFVGSIALNYKPVLKKCLNEKGLELGKVESAPINGLIEYHLSNE